MNASVIETTRKQAPLRAPSDTSRVEIPPPREDPAPPQRMKKKGGLERRRRRRVLTERGTTRKADPASSR